MAKSDSQDKLSFRRPEKPVRGQGPRRVQYRRPLSGDGGFRPHFGVRRGASQRYSVQGAGAEPDRVEVSRCDGRHLSELEDRLSRPDGDRRLPVRVVPGRDDRPWLSDWQFVARLSGGGPGRSAACPCPTACASTSASTVRSSRRRPKPKSARTTRTSPRMEIVAQGLVSKEDYEKLEGYALPCSTGERKWPPSGA